MPLYNSPEEAENKLTQLMLRAVPENPDGNKTLTFLASLMNMTRAGLHKYLKAKRIPPERVLQIVQISRITGFNGRDPIYGDEARVKREEFDEFVYTSR